MIIASRKPYYVEANATEINVWIYIYPYGTTKPTEASFKLNKKSFDSAVAEDLKVNIAPLISDYYDHKSVDAYPTAIVPSPGTEYLAVDIDIFDGLMNPIVSESHTAVDGWNAPWDVFPINPGIKNKLVRFSGDDYQIIPLMGGGCSGVRYTLSDGSNFTLPHNGDEGVFYAPVVLPQILSATNIRWYDVDILRDDSSPAYRIRYEVVCGTSYDDPFTINYINSFGVWESFSAQGSIHIGYTGSRENYISAESGLTSSYNADMKADFVVNTGYVAENFRVVVQELLASNQAELNTDSSVDFGLIIKSSRVNRIHKSEHLFNYQFNFETDKTMIKKV